MGRREGGGQDEKLINSNFLRPAAVNISALTAEMQLDPQKTSVGLDLLVGKLSASRYVWLLSLGPKANIQPKSYIGKICVDIHSILENPSKRPNIPISIPSSKMRNDDRATSDSRLGSIEAP